MDQTDLRLVELLADDSRAANSRLARRLGVSEGTVRQRLKRLQRRGLVRMQTQVNASEVPGGYLVVVGISVDGRDLEGCAARLNRFREVQRTMIVTGRFDILAVLLLNTHRGLVDFVTHKLSRVPGVRDSESFVCLKDYDPWYPAEAVVSAAADNEKAEL